MTNEHKPTKGLIYVVLVFFFWGFVAAGNDILIPVFKEALHLEQWQSQMIAFAFYVAYTVGSIIYMVISKWLKNDLVNLLGYKTSLVTGLLISAAGTLLFYPAASYNSFILMISGLFIVGIGFSLQQIVANPLTIALGNLNTGNQRLSMAGGINNVGTTIGPVLISFAIFGGISQTQNVALNDVKIPYLVLGSAFALMSIVIAFSSVPQRFNKTYKAATQEYVKTSVFKYPQLVFGMIAIFLYVGVEVSTASNLPELLKHELNLPTAAIAPYVSLFWASLMIGRWTSAADAFTNDNTMQKVLRFVMPYLAFGLFALVNGLVGHNIHVFYVYAIPILILIAADLYCMGKAEKQLFVFSILGIAALLIGMFSRGIFSAFAFISVGLFCSTLWPCIFNLAIKGLGNLVNQGSGYLIMMIMGGGFISVLQGKLADENLLGIKFSYLTGMVCFAYLAWYAYAMKSFTKNNN
jgi:FHS family L-fucose permease-like MFS transporter